LIVRFLEPLEPLGALANIAALAIVNARTGAMVATSAEVARTSSERRRGLLGRTGLPGGSALVISRCNAIHTIGMQFAIDVAFVDAQGCVRKIVSRLPPSRIAISPRARVTIEFAAGELEARALRVGDLLSLAPSTPSALEIPVSRQNS
jgi:uncharacterized membrane protein (UPF0127 family)